VTEWPKIQDAINQHSATLRELDTLREQLAAVTAERDELRAKLNSQAVVLSESHRIRGELQRECDRLRAMVSRLRHLADYWDECMEMGSRGGDVDLCVRELRAALNTTLTTGGWDATS
jgi:flagellar biosynthesis chaperone FliJ